MGIKTDLNAYLLDTHIFLWATRWANVHKLNEKVRTTIEEPDNVLYVSSISAYEIMNKYRHGKIPEYTHVVENIKEVIKELGAEELPVTMEHAEKAGALDWEHRNPFDRILASQALTDGLTLITNDRALIDCPLIETLQ